MAFWLRSSIGTVLPDCQCEQSERCRKSVSQPITRSKRNVHEYKLQTRYQGSLIFDQRHSEASGALVVAPD